MSRSDVLRGRAPSVTIDRRRLLAATGAAALAGWSGAGALAQQPPAAGRVLRIGNQKGVLNLLKGRGTLEKRLAPLGATVRWTEFNAGPVQLEALNVGSIDFGDVGEAPPVFAQAAGAPLVYAAATIPRPRSEAVLVPKDSALRAVADLKGRTVAFNKGSNVQFFLVKLLEKSGLKYQDVKPVFLAPADARAAFERGAVDAWVIWDPFLAAAEKTLGARQLADGTGVVNNRQYYFTSRDYATKNVDILKATLAEVDAIERWVGAHRSEAAQELAGVLGLDRPILDLAVGRAGYGLVPVTPEIIAEQQRIADTFFDLKLIPRRIDTRQAAPVALS